jgi:type IV pilus assembly protein PilP
MPNTSGGIAPDRLRRREELENYSLDSLKMVGTLEQNETRWALVVAPDGILHRVRVGNYLGKNNGQITLISPEIIQLTEIIGDGPGSWRERESSIALRQ